MTKILMNELHKLSVKEKIKVVQTIWDDIANAQTIDSISEDHKKILEQRISKINSGNVKFKPWEEIQAKFNEVK